MFKQDPETDYKTNLSLNRYIINSDIDVNVPRDFTISLQLFGRVQEGRQPGAGTQNILSALASTPNNAYPVFNPNGSYGGSAAFTSNLYEMTTGSGYLLDNERDLLANVDLRYNFSKWLPGLYVKGKVNVSSSSSSLVSRSKTDPVYGLSLDDEGDLLYSRFGAISDMGNAFNATSNVQVFYAQAAAGFDTTVDGSSVGGMLFAAFIYSIAKRQERNNDCRTGMDLLQTFEIVHDSCYPTLPEYPYYSSPSACPGTGLFEGTATQESRKISSIATVKKNLFVFQFLLSHNIPIMFEANIDNDFSSRGFRGGYNERHLFIWNKYGEDLPSVQRPSHSMICIGYSDSLKSFLVINSFGEQFGDHGLFWMSYNFFNECVQRAYFLYTEDNQKRIASRLESVQQTAEEIMNGYKYEKIMYVALVTKKACGLNFRCEHFDFKEETAMLEITAPQFAVTALFHHPIR